MSELESRGRVESGGKNREIVKEGERRREEEVVGTGARGRAKRGKKRKAEQTLDYVKHRRNWRCEAQALKTGPQPLLCQRPIC